MKLKNIIKRIQNFRVSDEMEEYEITEFFDEIRDGIVKLNISTKPQKELLILTLFQFLKNQDPELDENFSFIHLIEDIDKPYYECYNLELLRFNQKNPVMTSIVLLNRHINSLEERSHEWKISTELMKSISQNSDVTEYNRELALDFYKFQIEE